MLLVRALRSQKISEFKATLVYILSSRLVRVKQ